MDVIVAAEWQHVWILAEKRPVLREVPFDRAVEIFTCFDGGASVERIMGPCVFLPQIWISSFPMVVVALVR